MRLWSFEVKIKLTVSNVRECFFQALSNSKWANKGYLVASHIHPKVMQELKMLSELYGIGVIELNKENPSNSKILLDVEYRTNIHVESINRLNEVNFYIKTGRTPLDPFWM